MLKWNSEPRIRLISQGFNTWKVQILFTDTNLSATEISDRLAEVKAELAKQFGVPNSLLEYNRLLSRKPTRNGLLVQILITKQDLPSGAPRLRALPLINDIGITFSDMKIEADLFPYDEFDHPLTRAAMEARLKVEGFDLECIDWPALIDAIQEMSDTLKPIRGLTIGQGRMPGVGLSSRATYGIGHDQEGLLSSAWLGLRPVSNGDFIVEVSTANSGHKWGRNIYGRELEPRPGLQTRLEAQEGTRLALRDSQLISIRDGLLVFQRFGLDRRDHDAWNRVPAKLSARVVSARIFDTPDVFKLELREPAIVYGMVLSGSRISTTAPLFICGDVEEGVAIESSDSLRILGSVYSAGIRSDRHICISGDVFGSIITTGCTLQVDGGITDSEIHVTDVVAGSIQGGTVDAVRRASLEALQGNGSAATAIRINLRKYLEHQQVADQEAITELRNAILQIRAIFGPQITDQVAESTAQRFLLRWLKNQKLLGNGNYTHAEVQELRTILEMIPLIRDQLKAIGVELRDVTSQLQHTEDAPPE